ncbi:MAG: UrcA family protein [Erythrobacter sp.]
MKKTLILAAALIATSATANAQSTPTITVDTADLDLTTVDDQQRFDERVQDAAVRACRTPDRDLGARHLELACRDNLRTPAWAAIGHKPAK